MGPPLFPDIPNGYILLRSVAPFLFIASVFGPLYPSAVPERGKVVVVGSGLGGCFCSGCSHGFRF